MKITAALLRKHGACPDQVRLFRTTFPTGAEVTLGNVKLAQQAGLDLDWGPCLFAPTALAAYNAATAAALADYNAVVAPAWAAYYAATAAAWAACEAATAPAWAAYYAATAAALADYDAAIAPALAYRKAAIATAWVAAWHQSIQERTAQ